MCLIYIIHVYIYIFFFFLLISLLSLCFCVCLLAFFSSRDLVFISTFIIGSAEALPILCVRYFR